MARTEQLSPALPPDVVKRIADVLASGEYASVDEVALTALVEWSARRAAGPGDFAALRADIELGLDDIEAGRVFDRIVAQGRALSARASSSE